MNINDYEYGSQEIFLFRCDFKDEHRFEEYAKFLGENKDATGLNMPIDMDRLQGNKRAVELAIIRINSILLRKKT